MNNTIAYDSIEVGETSPREYWVRGEYLHWNKALEKVIKEDPDPVDDEIRATQKNTGSIKQPHDFYTLYLDDRDEAIRFYASIGRQILQKSVNIHNFEKTWNEKARELRIQSVVEGLKYATAAMPEYCDWYRKCTPDLTVASMAKDPKGFIHLLRHIVDSFLSHPYGSGYDEWIDSTGAFDHYFRIQRKKGSREELIEQGWRMWQAGINQQRQLYVVRFAFGVLLDLGLVQIEHFRTPSLDLPRLPLDPVDSPREGISSLGTCNSSTTSQRSKERRAKLQEGAKVSEEEQQERDFEEWTYQKCSSCWRIRDQIEELVSNGTYMQRCKRCHRIGRGVAYCSVSCQTIDWPRHKESFYCGKDLRDVVLPPIFRPPSSYPSPTLAYQYQFESLPPRPKDILYTIRQQVQRKGKASSETYEIKFEDEEEREWLESVREELATGLSVDQLQDYTEGLLQRLEWDDEVENYEELAAALMRQLCDEFKIPEVQRFAKSLGISFLDGSGHVLEGKRGKASYGWSEEGSDIDPTSYPTTEKKKKNKKKKNKKKNKTIDDTPSSSTAPPPPPRPTTSPHFTGTPANGTIITSTHSRPGVNNNEGPNDPPCTCGRIHDTQRGGIDEWMSWIPNGRNATAQDIIEGMRAFAEDVRRGG